MEKAIIKTSLLVFVLEMMFISGCVSDSGDSNDNSEDTTTNDVTETVSSNPLFE